MHVADCETPALFEERNQNFAVDFPAASLQSFAQGLSLKRIMPAQGRIATTDDDKIFAESFCRRADSFGDFFMFGASFLRRERARVRQDEEQRIFFREARRNAPLRPIGVHGNFVDGLHAGRVVVKHDDFAREIF